MDTVITREYELEHGVYEETETGCNYHRSHSKTRSNLEDALINYYGVKKGPKQCAIFPSGMSAIYNALDITIPDRGKLVYSKELYCDSLRVSKMLCKKKGATCIETDIFDDSNLIKIFEENPDISVLYFESCANPSGRMPSPHLLYQLKKRYRKSLTIIVDNTWLSGCSFSPFTYGANLVVESLTKYIGNCTYIGGMAVGEARFIKKMKGQIRLQGLYVAPIASLAFLKGLESVESRIERCGEISTVVAKYLETHPKVTRVMHPFLNSHPSYKHAKGMKYAPGVFCFHIATDRYMSAKERSDIVKSSGIAFQTSYGSDHSKINCWSKQTYHNIYDPDYKEEDGIYGLWIRLAVGCQSVTEDLIRCLDKLL